MRFTSHPDATAAQAGVLFVLGKRPGAGVGDVARGLGMGLPGASGLVDRMVGSGLIERRADERDGRSWCLFLTRSGEALRVAEDAQLTTPFVNLALVPEAASSFLLPARIGYARAFAMFALGEPVAAADALAWGLANQVVPRAELVATAERVATNLARQPIGALIATKRLMRPSDAITRHLEKEGKEFLERLRSPEAGEAFRAFAERRPPDFAKFA